MKYSDKEIIDGFRNSSKSVILFVYQKYSVKVQKYVTYNSGCERDAEDVLHDSILILFKEVLKKDFEIKSSFHKYFSSILETHGSSNQKNATDK